MVAVDMMLLLLLDEVELLLCFTELRDHFGPAALGAFLLGNGIVGA